MRRADQERAQGEPAPALPDEHGYRRDQRDDHEREGEARRLAADEHRRGQRAEKGQGGHELRSPANGDGRADGADERGNEKAGLLPDDALHRRRVGERGVQRRERARDGGDSRFGLAPSLVQEEADGQEHRRAGERERDAGLDADPAAVDGDDEEQDDADDDREPAEPREDPAAEQILERSLWLLRLGREPTASPARLRRRRRRRLYG